MSYKQPGNASLETLIDYAVGVRAGLKADEGFQALAASWDGTVKTLLDHRTSRDLARWALMESQRRVDVRRALFDAVGDLSVRTFLEAGKSAKASPYADLFGTVPANALRSLGPTKATAAVVTLLTKAKVLAIPAMQASLAAVEKATEALTVPDAEPTKARDGALTHDVVRGQDVALVEEFTAKTEANILQKVPGRKDLVQAFLAPPSREKKAVKPEVPPA